ncbi:hypothetical protein NS226_16795 [Aureimonas ureilytica]|uniref:Uncharacterized protein n=1 Tax=Aureimonas ureilytica TaxID=401562 RepID=A0A175R5G0_9HYPH|nr:hypothetical protein [Aureimonas ureilytica]KTQ89466.1 hypothetical protein NS226_16795 [Aureimonas ureilytica]
MAMNKPASPNVRALNEFVSKGGSVAADKVPKAEVRLPIRLPSQEFRDRIDTARKSKGLNQSATAWVLMAIAEKLEREGF